VGKEKEKNEKEKDMERDVETEKKEDKDRLGQAGEGAREGAWCAAAASSFQQHLQSLAQSMPRLVAGAHGAGCKGSMGARPGHTQAPGRVAEKAPDVGGALTALEAPGTRGAPSWLLWLATPARANRPLGSHESQALVLQDFGSGLPLSSNLEKKRGGTGFTSFGYVGPLHFGFQRSSAS